MKIAHSVTIRVFCSQEENEEDIMSGLKWLVPLDFDKEKVIVQQKLAEGFNERKIRVIEATLTKERHTRAFIESLQERLLEHNKNLLLHQLVSRIDDNANFFVRFEKENVARNLSLLVTDGGNCYHIRIKVAAYPSTKEAAMRIMRNVLELK